MNKSNRTNCCTPNEELKDNTDCCTSQNRNVSMKQKIGLFILGLALIFALNTAFKEVVTDNDACKTTEGLVTISINDFAWIKTNKKVVYIVLKGNDSSQNKKIISKVSNTVNELNETESSADLLVLESNTSNYNDIVSKLKIEEIPSIAVVGKSTSIIKAINVNSIKLIRAYDTAIVTSATCSTSEKNSCIESSKVSCDSNQRATCSPKQTATCNGLKKSN
ncbi:hypothetical protein [Tenacibaculum halocynthiae]|uniref:hypothetical protein n=1 Tax=Tenacibaculum halocynthiae TaxID=1254437 RepID=UPI003893C769